MADRLGEQRAGQMGSLKWTWTQLALCLSERMSPVIGTLVSTYVCSVHNCTMRSLWKSARAAAVRSHFMEGLHTFI